MEKGEKKAVLKAKTRTPKVLCTQQNSPQR